MIQTDRSSFQKQLNTILTSLQSQEYISHQWLNQMQNEYRFSIYLYDNGDPLYYEQLHEDNSGKRQTSLREKAIRRSQVDIFYDNSGESAYHEEFSLHDSSHSYYASVGYLTQDTDRLSFVIFYDRPDIISSPVIASTFTAAVRARLPASPPAASANAAVWVPKPSPTPI